MVCGQNCTFILHANGSVLACGEGSYGRLGQGNSDDIHAPSIVTSLQGKMLVSTCIILSINVLSPVYNIKCWYILVLFVLLFFSIHPNVTSCRMLFFPPHKIFFFLNFFWGAVVDGQLFYKLFTTGLKLTKPTKY